MNKEVIYLEPEDDITDILTKLQQAEQKLVALVPPKKATMLRSAVNMKLVARVAKECEKVVVVVTADPALLKMAMAARIPVAKTLNSRPVIPTEENLRAAGIDPDDSVIDESLDDALETDQKADKAANRGGRRGKTAETAAEPHSASGKMPSEGPKNAHDDFLGQTGSTLDLTEEGLLGDPEKAKKGDKKAKKSAKSAGDDKKADKAAKIKKYAKIGVPVALVVIIGLIWALIIAPRATITVVVSSSPSSFAEDIKFTTDENAEDVENGVFYVEKQTHEGKYTTDFTATGEEDRGTKATGQLKVTYSFTPLEVAGEGFSVKIAEGTTFSTKEGYKYVATAPATFEWDGETTPITCDGGNVSNLSKICYMSKTINAEAMNAGPDYNIQTTTADWNKYQGMTVASASTFTGGTENKVKTVIDSDVEIVAESQKNEHEEKGKSELFEDLSKDLVPITPSYAAEIIEKKSTPGIGDEVGNNTTPSLTTKVEYSVYTIKKSQLEEYIKHKLDLGDDQRVYSYGDYFFDRFTGLDDSVRLKTTVATGPTVSEDVIFDKASGRKTGEVQSLLRSINGVDSVEIRTNYFWVWSIPSERDRVTIDLTIEGEDNAA